MIDKLTAHAKKWSDMAKNPIEIESRKLSERIRKGKITLKKATILMEDLEIQMAVLKKDIEDAKAAIRGRKFCN